jgi:hypothetical protein
LPDLRGADVAVTRLSDLLAFEPAVHVVAPDALRWHVDVGDDPILYRVDFDVLPPRPLPRSLGCWVADRTTYGPGLLPAGADLPEPRAAFTYRSGTDEEHSRLLGVLAEVAPHGALASVRGERAVR